MENFKDNFLENIEFNESDLITIFDYLKIDKKKLNCHYKQFGCNVMFNDEGELRKHLELNTISHNKLLIEYITNLQANAIENELVNVEKRISRIMTLVTEDNEERQMEIDQLGKEILNLKNKNKAYDKFIKKNQESKEKQNKEIHELKECIQKQNMEIVHLKEILMKLMPQEFNEIINVTPANTSELGKLQIKAGQSNLVNNTLLNPIVNSFVNSILNSNNNDKHATKDIPKDNIKKKSKYQKKRDIKPNSKPPTKNHPQPLTKSNKNDGTRITVNPNLANYTNSYSEIYPNHQINANPNSFINPYRGDHNYNDIYDSDVEEPDCYDFNLDYDESDY